MQSTLYLGIDGGGSKCHAVLYRQGDGIIGTGVAGPANPLQGYERALESILEAAALAAADAGLPVDATETMVAGLGLAGLNLRAQHQRMQQWAHPFARAYLSTDLEIACLGAHDGADGGVVIAGTGSSGYVRVGKLVRIIGGTGFPAGDTGSGAWLGLMALKAVFEAADGLAPPTALTDLVERHVGASGREVAERIAGATTSVYAGLAPLVFDAVRDGDATAIGIVREGAAYLGRMVRKLKECNPPRLSLIGGVAPSIHAWLDEDVQQALSPALASPAMGAVLLARAGDRRTAAGRRLASQP
ncbi:MAG TPA: BadF/BadG/BcrA/BcrD ATPase family protein [Woeseiaceae bacterium]|nr:BadF/BadG/BcrA/BcrD ATPase family protein [Woeseiaceae bacterium]